MSLLGCLALAATVFVHDADARGKGLAKRSVALDKARSCSCPRRRWRPVCGKDGKTYRSRCHAKCDRAGVAYKGVCAPPSPEPEGCLCTLEFIPVCGDDGVTYGNTCQAECAGAKVVSEGECPPPTVPEDCVCTKLFDPVCGADGVTYGNPCEAACADATIVSKGVCPDPAPASPDECCTEEAPICFCFGNCATLDEVARSLCPVDGFGESCCKEKGTEPKMKEPKEEPK